MTLLSPTAPIAHPRPASNDGATSSSSWADRTGVLLSTCCGVHCLVTPGLLVLVPTLGGWFANERVHWIALALIAPVAFWALWRGARRSSEAGAWRWAPLGLGVVGLLALTAGAWNHPPTCCSTDALNQGYAGMDAEAWRWVGVNVLGSLALVAGHTWNLLRTRREGAAAAAGDEACACPGC